MGDAESFGKAGEPGVPAFSQLVALPQGAEPTATVAGVESYTIDGVRPFPKQEEAVDGPADGLPEDVPAKVFADPPFKFDARSYSGRAPIPAKLGGATKAGTMRDLALAAVHVAGAQFRPSQRKLEVLTRVTVRVDFGGANSGAFLSKAKRPTSAFEQAFPRVYGASVANAGAVAAEAAQTRSDRDAFETVPPCGEDMLIVTSPTLSPAAETLAEARRATGMVVDVRETGTADGQVGTEGAQIREFIRGELNDGNCTRPTYLILLGDTSHVPSFLEPCPVADCPDVTSDLSYSLDGIGNDPFADVLMGRISANTLAIANTVVSKIVTYETTPPAPPGDDFYNHATVTSNFDGLGPVDSRTFTRASETVRAGLRTRGHVVDRLYSAQSAADIQQFSNGIPMPAEIRRPAEAWTAGRDQIVNAFNEGRFFLMHRDHGSRLGWANPGININDVGLLANGTQLPVVFAINCSSAGFQFPGNPSFNERLLNTPAGGAAGVFGDTEVSPTVPNTRLAIGFADALFPETVPAAGPPAPLSRMGEVLVAGKVAMGNGAPVESQLTGNTYREHLLWHYLGDPSMQMWSATPADFQNVQTLYEPRSGTNPIDGPAFGVQVSLDPAGTDGAIATLRKDGEPIGRAIVENGFATIQPDRRTDSSGLTVALERDGFLPREVLVSAPTPSHSIQCPPTISNEFGVISRGQVLGSGGVPIKDGLVNLRFTTPTRTFTRSVLTNNEGRWIRQEPIGATEHGPWKIEAFFEDKGVKDAVCEFVVP